MGLSLKTIRKRRGPYPADLLDGCRSALLLFAAGFHGANDGIWVAGAGIPATAVDLDGEKLGEMRRLYPALWEFVEADCFAYAAELVEQGRSFDLVSIDPPSNLTVRCLSELPWAQLTERVCVFGVAGRLASPGGLAPPGYALTGTVRRSNRFGGTYWLVFERLSLIPAES